MKRAAAVTAAAVALAWALPAAAFEHQHHLGADGGLAILVIDQKGTPSIGGGGGLHYAYGLTDAFNLMVEGAFCPVALEELPGKDVPHNRPTMVTNLGAGVSYVFDVTRWVPYVGVLATTYWMTGGTVDSPGLAGGAALALGLDYEFTRHFTMGLAVRQHFIFSDFTNYPSYTQVFGRLEYTWGF